MKNLNWEEAINRLRKQDSSNIDYLEFKEFLNAKGNCYDVLMGLVDFSEKHPKFINDLKDYFSGKPVSEKEKNRVTDSDYKTLVYLVGTFSDSFPEMKEYFSRGENINKKKKITDALERDGNLTSLAELITLENMAFNLTPLAMALFLKEFNVSEKHIKNIFEREVKAVKSQGYSSLKLTNIDSLLEDLKKVYPSILQSNISRANFLLSYIFVKGNNRHNVINFISENIRAMNATDLEKVVFVKGLEKIIDEANSYKIKDCYNNINTKFLVEEFEKDLNNNNIEKINKNLTPLLINVLLKNDIVSIKHSIREFENTMDVRSYKKAKESLKKLAMEGLIFLGMNEEAKDIEKNTLINKEMYEKIKMFIEKRDYENDNERTLNLEDERDIEFLLEEELYLMHKGHQKEMRIDVLMNAVKKLGRNYTMDLIDDIIHSKRYSINLRKIEHYIEKMVEKEKSPEEAVAMNLLGYLQELRDILLSEEEKKMYQKMIDALKIELKTASNIISKHIDKEIIHTNIGNLIPEEEIFQLLNEKLKKISKAEQIEFVKKLESSNNSESLIKKYPNKFVGNFEALFHEILLEDIKGGKKIEVEDKYIQSFIKKKIEMLPEIKLIELERDLEELRNKGNDQLQQKMGLAHMGFAQMKIEGIWRETFNEADAMIEFNVMQKAMSDWEKEINKNITKCEKEIEKIKNISQKESYEDKNLIRLALLGLSEKCKLPSSYKDIIAKVIETDSELFNKDYDYMDKYDLIDLGNRAENHWIVPLINNLKNKARNEKIPFDSENFFADYIVGARKYKDNEIIYMMKNLDLSRSDVFKSLVLKMENILSFVNDDMLKEFKLGTPSLWKDIDFASRFAKSFEKETSSFNKIVKLLPDDVAEVFKFFKMNNVEDWSSSLREVFLSMELESGKNNEVTKVQRAKKKI